MKKSIILLILIFATAVSPCWSQQRADQQHLTDPESFSMIVFGDPQNYVKVSFYQPIFELCTAWMADNVSNLNIKAVLFTGDMVNRNETIIPQTNSEDQTSKQMIQCVSHCLERLDNKVPYFISGGNHDYGYVKGDEPFTNLNTYYTIDRNTKTEECIVSTFPNKEGKVSLENAAFEITSSHWSPVLVICMEWLPRDEVVDWALKLCQSEKYKNHMVILQVHSFLKAGPKAERTTDDSYALKGNSGKQLWEKLVYPSDNIRLVVCGHTGSKEQNFEKNTAYRQDKNKAGKVVHQMMFNAQFLAGNGGDGWTRILEFCPDGKTILATTYSPFFGISPLTKQYAHRTEKCDQFKMVIK